MAQKQFNNYQDDILSWDLREAMLGVLKPGRMCGYDTFTHVNTNGGVINIHINHTATGIQKASNAVPPVLGSRTGVVMTTQGILIHDDTADIDMAIDDAGYLEGERWDIIYMQHWYLNGVPGSNPATYGIKKGTPGNVWYQTVLDSPSKQVPLVWVQVLGGPTGFDMLHFHPHVPELMGSDILARIGDNYNDDAPPSMTMVECLRKSIADLVTALSAKKLDDLAVPDDNTDLDVTIYKHGLMKKLPNVAGQFLNGVGSWVAVANRRIVWAASSPLQDFDKSSFGNFAGNSGTLDLSSLIPSDGDFVFLRINASGINGSTGAISIVFANANGVLGNSVVFSLPAGSTGAIATNYMVFPIGGITSRTLYWSVTYGTPSTHLDFIVVKVLGWQTGS